MKISTLLAAAAAMVSTGFLSSTASAQEPFIGELRVYGNTYCPRNWANAEGQLLPISQNTALFSLLGTYYGGDGRTTFGLPDLTSRAPIGVGQGPGLSNYSIGQRTGAESTKMNVATMPSHSHVVRASANNADTHDADDDYFGTLTLPAYGPTAGKGNFNDEAVTYAGDAPEADISMLQPAIAMRWCIALEGIYPSRN